MVVVGVGGFVVVFSSVEFAAAALVAVFQETHLIGSKTEVLLSLLLLLL